MKKCSHCGADLHFSGGLWALCTKCLYNESLAIPESECHGPNRRFGNYELDSVLGRGGMGIVYKATQITPHRLVALKMLIGDAEAAPTRVLRRFSIEAEAAAKLDHPNIVPIYEVGEHDGQPFLSMRFIAGETLRRKFSTGELSLLPHAKIWTTQVRGQLLKILRVLTVIARAVHHAHEHGVLHRDLKPGNIMIDSDGIPHLTDFGLAKILKASGETDGNIRATSPGTAVGTVCYMSPEQGRGAPLSPASDVYSLGAILYEALTGSPPFTGSTLVEVVRATAEEAPVAPCARNPLVDPDLNTICLKCLEKNPAARYRSASELADDLERWQRHEPIRARPAGPVLRASRWVARNRLGAMLIASLCLGLATVLLLLNESLTRQRRLDEYRAYNIRQVNEDIQDIFDSASTPFTRISSTRLADLADLQPTPPGRGDRNLAFGLTINTEPFGLAIQHAPFLNALEKRIGKLFDRTVLVDLLLYKDESRAMADLIAGQVGILRVDPFLFVLNQKEAPGIEALVSENQDRKIIIFASGSSQITNLSQIVGKRFIFGQETSVITFWAKVHLARHGIVAADLDIGYASGARDRDPQGITDRDPGVQANKRAVQAVLTDKADAGVATQRQFESNRYRTRRGGLVELFSFSVMPDVYAISRALAAEPELVRALLEGFESFKGARDSRLLAPVTDNTGNQRFQRVEGKKLEEIRAAMTNDFARFEGKQMRVTLQ